MCKIKFDLNKEATNVVDVLQMLKEEEIKYIKKVRSFSKKLYEEYLKVGKELDFYSILRTLQDNFTIKEILLLLTYQVKKDFEEAKEEIIEKEFPEVETKKNNFSNPIQELLMLMRNLQP